MSGIRVSPTAISFGDIQAGVSYQKKVKFCMLKGPLFCTEFRVYTSDKDIKLTVKSSINIFTMTINVQIEKEGKFRKTVFISSQKQTIRIWVTGNVVNRPFLKVTNNVSKYHISENITKKRLSEERHTYTNTVKNKTAVTQTSHTSQYQNRYPFSLNQHQKSPHTISHTNTNINNKESISPIKNTRSPISAKESKISSIYDQIKRKKIEESNRYHSKMYVQKRSYDMTSTVPDQRIGKQENTKKTKRHLEVPDTKTEDKKNTIEFTTLVPSEGNNRSKVPVKAKLEAIKIPERNSSDSRSEISGSNDNEELFNKTDMLLRKYEDTEFDTPQRALSTLPGKSRLVLSIPTSALSSANPKNSFYDSASQAWKINKTVANAFSMGSSNTSPGDDKDGSRVKHFNTINGPLLREKLGLKGLNNDMSSSSGKNKKTGDNNGSFGSSDEVFDISSMESSSEDKNLKMGINEPNKDNWNMNFNKYKDDDGSEDDFENDIDDISTDDSDDDNGFGLNSNLQTFSDKFGNSPSSLGRNSFGVKSRDEIDVFSVSDEVFEIIDEYFRNDNFERDIIASYAMTPDEYIKFVNRQI